VVPYQLDVDGSTEILRLMDCIGVSIALAAGHLVAPQQILIADGVPATVVNSSHGWTLPRILAPTRAVP